MVDISEQERTTLHRIANRETGEELPPDHVKHLASLGLIERHGDSWAATPAGRFESIPRPAHL